MKGQQWLAEWKNKADGVVSQARLVNQQEAENRANEQEKAKQAGNPWVYICNNCNLSRDGYLGEHDVTSLRNAMVNRRDDITKSGGMKKVK